VLRTRRDLLQPEHRVWLLLPRRVDLLLLIQWFAHWSLLPAGRSVLRRRMGVLRGRMIRAWASGDRGRFLRGVECWRA
jgi:hypothetical protein